MTHEEGMLIDYDFKVHNTIFNYGTCNKFEKVGA